MRAFEEIILTQVLSFDLWVRKPDQAIFRTGGWLYQSYYSTMGLCERIKIYTETVGGGLFRIQLGRGAPRERRPGSYRRPAGP